MSCCVGLGVPAQSSLARQLAGTTPSGWSTRRENGGDGKPFPFQPGQNLIAGWTEGVLKMREGERAKIHVPPALGYGGSDMGSKGSGWFIPANSREYKLAGGLRLCLRTPDSPALLHVPSCRLALRH